MADRPHKKKRKKPSPLRDYFFYLLMRGLAVFLQLPAPGSSLRLARWLGRAMYRVYHRGRERALGNLRMSYPDKSAAWHERVAQRSFEHLVMFAFDMFYYQRLIRRSNWQRVIELHQVWEVLGLLQSGRGVIMVTGHYGSFITAGAAMEMFGIPLFSVARPIDNRYINRYLYGTLLGSHTVIYKKGASRTMIDLLANGQALGIVGDQNASRKDVFVDFFGRKAATYKSIALMALQYNVPIAVSYTRRINDQFRFRMGVERIIYPQEWQDKSDPVEWITAQWTAAIESFVRADPEQYWWIHRRWKTRPRDELPDAAAVPDQATLAAT